MDSKKEMKNDNEHEKIVFALCCILIVVIIMVGNLFINPLFNKIDKAEGDYISRLPKTYLPDNITIRFLPNQIALIGCNNPEYRWTSRFNNEGFRDEDVPQNESIIAIFGDSFVYGYCLQDNQTLDYFLEKRLSSKDVNYKVINFGYPGYNLKSSLRIMDNMTKKYKIKYAIVYFTPNDDLIECDISCRYILKKYNYSASKAIETNPEEYVESEMKKFPERLKDFGPILEEFIEKKEIQKKSKLLFYIDSRKENVSGILDQKNISHIEPYDILKNELIIPLDGHPNEEFNNMLAGKIAEYIFAEESRGQK